MLQLKRPHQIVRFMLSPARQNRLCSTMPEDSYPHKSWSSKTRNFHVYQNLQSDWRRIVFLPHSNKYKVVQNKSAIQVSQLLNKHSTFVEKDLNTSLYLEGKSNERLLKHLHDNTQSPNFTQIAIAYSSRMMSMSLSDLLLFMDLMYHGNCQNLKIYQRFFLCVDVLHTKLSFREALQILFYAGCIRTVKRSLLNRLEETLTDSCHRLSFLELCLLSHSFFICNHSIRSPKLLKFLEESLALNVHANRSLSRAINILKAMQHADFFTLSNFSLCLNELSKTSYLKDLTVSLLMHIVHAMAAFKMPHEDLLGKISNLCIQKAGSAREKDLGRIIWSFSMLRFPVDKRLSSALTKKLLSGKQLQEHPGSYLEAVMALELAGHNSEKIIKHVVISKWSRKRIESNFQRNLIFTLYQMSNPGVSTNLQLEASPVGEIASNLKYRQGLYPLYVALCQLLGPDKVKLSVLTSFSYIADLQLKLRNGVPQSQVGPNIQLERKPQLENHCSVILQKWLPELGVKMPKSEVLLTRVNGNGDEMERRIAIRVFSTSQYLANSSTLSGYSHFETSFLNRLGYDTLVIPPEIAQHMASFPDDMHEIVKEKVLRVLDINLSS